MSWVPATQTLNAVVDAARDILTYDAALQTRLDSVAATRNYVLERPVEYWASTMMANPLFKPQRRGAHVALWIPTVTAAGRQQDAQVVTGQLRAEIFIMVEQLAIGRHSEGVEYATRDYAEAVAVALQTDVGRTDPDSRFRAAGCHTLNLTGYELRPVIGAESNQGPLAYWVAAVFSFTQYQQR